MWQVLCPFYIPTNTLIHAYVCIFWLCPFFLLPLLHYRALTLTHTHTHTQRHITSGSNQRDDVRCCCRCSAQLNSNAFRLLRLIQFSYSSYALTRCVFVSALNLVNYCSIRAERILNTIFVDSLCLHNSYMHTHTHTHTYVHIYLCCRACVSVREQSAMRVCVCHLQL